MFRDAGLANHNNVEVLPSRLFLESVVNLVHQIGTHAQVIKNRILDHDFLFLKTGPRDARQPDLRDIAESVDFVRYVPGYWRALNHLKGGANLLTGLNLRITSLAVCSLALGVRAFCLLLIP